MTLDDIADKLDKPVNILLRSRKAYRSYLFAITDASGVTLILWDGAKNTTCMVLGHCPAKSRTFTMFHDVEAVTLPRRSEGIR